MSQLTLDLDPPVVRSVFDGRPHLEAFVKFHRANPQVFVTFEQVATYAKRQGQTRISARRIWENRRSTPGISRGDDDFRCNNNHIPFYARLLVWTRPEFEGVFELRESKRSEHIDRDILLEALEAEPG